MFDSSHPEVLDAVRRALEEDIGPGDVTSQACIPSDRKASGVFVAREPMVIAGVELLAVIYEMRGGVDDLIIECATGAAVDKGAVIARVRGNARTLLECERTSLNFIQRLINRSNKIGLFLRNTFKSFNYL